MKTKNPKWSPVLPGLGLHLGWQYCEDDRNYRASIGPGIFCHVWPALDGEGYCWDIDHCEGGVRQKGTDYLAMMDCEGYLIQTKVMKC